MKGQSYPEDDEIKFYYLGVTSLKRHLNLRKYVMS